MNVSISEKGGLLGPERLALNLSCYVTKYPHKFGRNTR
ncbi:hypothetical protein FIV00_09405 [Labrenzia sp. THAF82]|nr:hypothetical protein FIV00_09405 [Labrenzia sp. THAF82]